MRKIIQGAPINVIEVCSEAARIDWRKLGTVSAGSVRRFGPMVRMAGEFRYAEIQRDR